MTRFAASGSQPRIAYLQFTNPAGYPPLEHSSRILASAGWEVLFLGSSAFGADTFRIPAHPNITVRHFSVADRGLRLRVRYLQYIAWTINHCLRHRPHWIYASEPLSCLAALSVRTATGCNILYHEHDSPNTLGRVVGQARKRVAQTAEICVLPQADRLAIFQRQTGREGPTLCVWNCPGLGDVAPARSALAADRAISFYFHGSLNEARLPSTVLTALKAASDAATLHVVGYETVGSQGYMARFLGAAAALGLTNRVHYYGALDDRAAMLAIARRFDVGLAFMPAATGDVNMHHMTGASNKPFDYMASGQMILVSDLPDWRAMFVDTGYGKACDPLDADSVASAMRWCAANPQLVREMGEAGRRRIARDWNYEACFAPVAERLSATAKAAALCPQ